MVFNQLVWDTILSGVDNHKGGIEREYFFIFCLFNLMKKMEAIYRGVTRC